MILHKKIRKEYTTKDDEGKRGPYLWKMKKKIKNPLSEVKRKKNSAYFILEKVPTNKNTLKKYINTVH